jgi:hypothetical protein
MAVGERRGELREPASYTVAGFLAAFALFAAVLALVWYPGRVGTAAILLALVGAAMGGPQRRLAAAAVLVATVCWFAGMLLAVLFERPVF